MRQLAVRRRPVRRRDDEQIPFPHPPQDADHAAADAVLADIDDVVAAHA